MYRLRAELSPLEINKMHLAIKDILQFIYITLIVYCYIGMSTQYYMDPMWSCSECVHQTDRKSSPFTMGLSSPGMMDRSRYKK